VSQVMSIRQDRPLMLVDLAVPRNIDPRVRKIPGVVVLDMDDIQAYAMNADMGSHPDIAAARSILKEEVGEYRKLLRIVPFIGELHRKVEKIRQQEVERVLRNLHSPEPQITAQFDLFSRALVRKILHEPTMHLRSEENEETLNDYVDTLARLFDLSENSVSNQEGI